MTYAMEQGQGGLRFLTLTGLLASCMNSVLVCIGCTGAADDDTGTLFFLPAAIAVFQAFLACTCSLFELELAWLQRCKLLNCYQDYLVVFLPCFADVSGRGLVYLLQGVIWSLLCTVHELNHLVVGLWLLVVSICHFGVHCECLPKTVLRKRRRHGVSREMHMEGEEQTAMLRKSSTDLSRKARASPRTPRGHKVAVEPPPPQHPSEVPREPSRDIQSVAAQRSARGGGGARRAELQDPSGGADEDGKRHTQNKNCCMM